MTECQEILEEAQFKRAKAGQGPFVIIHIGLICRAVRLIVDKLNMAPKHMLSYTREDDMKMWKFFLKKLRRGDPEAVERRSRIWQEYEEHHPERGWKNYETHFRRQMLPFIAGYPLDKADTLLVLENCPKRLDEWQWQKNVLERELNCTLQVAPDGGVESCVALKDHAEQGGATTSAENRRPSGHVADGTYDAPYDISSDSSEGSSAEAEEPDNVDVLEPTVTTDEELYLDLSGEEPDGIDGTQAAAVPMEMQSQHAESSQRCQSQTGAAVSAIQAGSSSSAPTPDSSSSDALPVIKPGMSYERQKRICRQRMVLILEKKQPASTFLNGVTEPLRSQMRPLVEMFHAVLKADGGNDDPETFETGRLSSQHR